MEYLTMATELLKTISAALVISNDALIALNVYLVSLALRPWGNSISWTAAVIIYVLAEAFQNLVIYIQIMPATATCFAFSGSMQCMSQILMAMDRIKKAKKEAEDVQAATPVISDEKLPVVDEEKAEPAQPVKLHKWGNRISMGLPIYFVGVLSASTLYLHESIVDGKELSGDSKWDLVLKALLVTIVLASQGCTMWLAKIVGRKQWFARGQVCMGVEGLAVVLLMRVVARWALQQTVNSSMSLLWPPFGAMYEEAQKFQWR